MSLPETYRALQFQPNADPAVEVLPLPKPGKNQVLVKMEFAPINPSDIGMMKGRYGPGTSRNIGLEGSGTIAALGESLLVPHKVGDRVHVTGTGTMAEYLLADSERCSPILQPDLSFEQAACHLVNPGTVVYMGTLAEKGGHKAAIHSAGASALGRMLIRYFKKKGIKLINLVRKDEYIEELTKEEGADYVLNMTAPDFQQKLKEIAEKENATIAFEAVGGDVTGKIFSAMPPGSTLHVYGGLGGAAITNIGIFDFFQNKTMKGLHLSHYIEEVTKNGTIGDFFKEIHSNLPTIFKSHIQKVFKLEEITEALAYYHENSSKGKVLLRP